MRPNFNEPGEREADRLKRLEETNPAKAAHQQLLNRIKMNISMVWTERLCSWCGKEYNQLDPGARRDHCSDSCFEEADLSAKREQKQAKYQRERVRKTRDKRYRSKADVLRANMDSKFEALKSGTTRGQRISAVDAGYIWEIKPENARLWLDRFEAAGLIRYCGQGARGQRIWEVCQ